MDKASIAVILNARQLGRLQRQVKSLYDGDFDLETLRRWRDGWERELAFLHLDPELIADIDTLTAEMESGSYSESTLDNARTRVACYRPASWATLRELGIDLSGYMNDFGAVDPDLKRQFKRKYEANKRLTSQQQADWLKKIVLPWLEAWQAGRIAKVQIADTIAAKQEQVDGVINAAKRFLRRR